MFCSLQSFCNACTLPKLLPGQQWRMNRCLDRLLLKFAGNKISLRLMGIDCGSSTYYGSKEDTSGCTLFKCAWKLSHLAHNRPAHLQFWTGHMYQHLDPVSGTLKCTLLRWRSSSFFEANPCAREQFVSGHLKGLMCRLRCLLSSISPNLESRSIRGRTSPPIVCLL